jgi:hypothetical protein
LIIVTIISQQLLKLDVPGFTMNGVRYFARLKKLDNLLFDDYPGCYEGEEELNLRNYYTPILQIMPWLKILGLKIMDCDTEPYWDPQFFHQLANTKLDIYGKSQLEEICVSGTLPENASFPDLKILYVHKPSPDILSHIKVCNELSTLFIYGVDQKLLAQILQQVGSQLDHLFVHFTPGAGFDLYNIFFLCPNLSKLEIEASGGGGVSRFARWVSEHSFRKLKKFFAFFNGPAPRGIVKYILNAPLIEEVKFYDIELRRAECRLFRRVTCTKLQNLHTIHFDAILSSEIEVAEDLRKMMKIIMCSAPKLVEVNVMFANEQLRQKWRSMDMSLDFFALLMDLKFDRLKSSLLKKYARC